MHTLAYRRGILLLQLAAFLVLESTSGMAATLFTDNFNRPDGVLTNEYDFWNGLFRSADWELNSGSFFIQNNQAWSGIPDDCSNGSTSPNAQSTNCTDSAIFRLNSRRVDFGDVKVAFSLNSSGLITTPSTPAVAWDGIHIFLRYQSEYNLYYASINRRDHTSVIKKKCAGGTDNGGTYYELTNYVPHAWSPNAWQHVYATVKNNSDGTVTIALYDDNGLVVQAVDNNRVQCAPITSPGAVGMRGDNNNFRVDDFVVSDLSPSSLACDVNGDRSVNVVDVQVMINQALGMVACATDINQDGICNVIDVQRVVNAASTGICLSP